MTPSKRHCLSLLVLVLALPIIACAANTDTLWLKNQSVLIGELQNIKLGRVQFDAEDVGVVTIKYDKIKTIKATTKPHRLETINKQLLFGLLVPSPVPGSVIMVSGKDSLQLDISSISELQNYGQSWKTKVSGNANIGYSYTKSSRIGRLNYSGELRYKGRKWEAGISFTSIVTRDSVTRYRERDDYNSNCYYLINQHLYGGAIARFQRNAQLGVESRWQQGIGIGSKFLTSKRDRGNATTGIVVNEERSFKGGDFKILWEWALQAGYNFFSFDKPKINFSLSEAAYFGLTQTNRIRLDGNLKADWEIFSDFNINASVYQSFDGKSPATNRARTDFGFVFGFGYSF